MLYAIVSADKADAAPLRHQTRPAHKEYVKGIETRIVDAGATLRPDGEIAATILVIETETVEEAQRIADADPYVAAGIFAFRTVGLFRMSHRDGQPKR